MRLPDDFDITLKNAQEKTAKEIKLNGLKPIADKIIADWDKQPEAKRKVIEKIFKNFANFIDSLRGL